jgi:5'-3' exonuclease
MGIYGFFPWFKKNFNENIKNINKNKSVADLNIEIDNFIIDLNGIFHPIAQEVYKYGNSKVGKRLLSLKPNPVKTNKKQEMFQKVCDEIDKLFKIVNPKKRFILCVDGTAPQAKQLQQRKRRFKSSLEDNSKKDFDSNCLTPGTKFMDHMTKYIDWYIKKQMNQDSNWGKVEIIFSNEKVPGEGEQKGINFIRYLDKPLESYCIHGLDADLIMLSIATKLDNIFILREDQYNPNNEYFFLDIGKSKNDLIEKIYCCKENDVYNYDNLINDFILICFLIGNDFLPQIPCLEVWNNGIDTIIELYKNVCSKYGYLSNVNETGDVVIVKDSLRHFFGELSKLEKELLEDKINSKTPYFPDSLVEIASYIDKSRYVVDIDLYNNLYYVNKFDEDIKIKDVCDSYIEGIQWVISYYTKGVPNWKWYYPYHYAPFASNIYEHIENYVQPDHVITEPNTPYNQLMCVLPSKSADLIPEPLASLLRNETSPIKHYYPEEFKIDISGKRKEYEGIAILPFIDTEFMKKVYDENVIKVSDSEISRNIIGRSFSYTFSTKNRERDIDSYYGKLLKSKVNVNIIDF